MYQGYFCMGGTEIINNPRTAGYARTASQLQDLSIPIPPKEPDQVLATNAFTNPSFKGDGSPTVVYENLFTNPNLVSDGTRVTVWENFFTNPGFETAAPGSTTIPAQTIYRNDLNAPTTTGWTASLVAANGSGATGASVALQGAAGTRVVRVQSDGATTSVNPTAAVRMTRTLTTVVGVQYTVTYQYKSVSSACMVRVSLGTAQGPETSSNVLAAGTAVVFTATATTTTLAFDVYDNPGSTGTRDSVYGELGDVTVTQASYTVPTAPTEVWRNRAIVPIPDITRWSPGWGTGGAGNFTSGAFGPGGATMALMEWTTPGGGGASQRMVIASGSAYQIPVSVGETVQLSIPVAGSGVAQAAIGVDWYNGTTWISYVSMSQTNLSTNPATPTLLTYTTPAAPAGTTHMRVYVNNTAPAAIGNKMWVGSLMVGRGPRFTGAGMETSDPDLTPAWTGAVNNSASVLNGVTPATPNNGHLTNGGGSACILTTGPGVQYGTKALRIIPLGTSVESHYQIGAYNTVLLQPGKTYTALATITVLTAQTGTLSVAARRINAPDSVLSGMQNNSAQAPNVPGTYQIRYTWTVSAGATWSVVRLYNGASVGNGEVVWDDVTIVEGAYNGPHIAGDVAYNDPDLTVVWAGTANASNSRVTGEVIRNLPSIADRCIAVRSSKVVNGVAFPLRLIAKRSTNDTFVNFNVPTAAFPGGTFMATRYQEAVIPGLISRALWIGSPAQEIAPVNVAGTHEYRLNYTTLSSNGGARFYHGAPWGSADVWWTMPVLITGKYTGPWFAGDHPIDDPDFVTQWSGAADNSTTVMLAEGVEGILNSGSNVRVIHSDQYGGSARVIAKDSTALGAITTLQVDSGSTVIVVAHRKDASAAANQYFPSLTDGSADPASTDSVPDDPGDYNLRIRTTMPFGSQLYMTSTQVPGVDIWYSNLGMFEGDYNGAWFSGDSIPMSDNVQYRWAGEPNASPSEMVLLSPEPQATYYCNINSFKLDECTTLRDSLGDDVAYEAGNISEAPWYSMNNIFQGAENPSRKFLGAYAAEVSSLSDSPTIAGMTEGITDGGIIGRARRAIPTFRFRVVLLAVDEEGLEYGTTWLNSAISDAVCATHGPSCGSVDLTFLVDCPPERRDDETDAEYETRLDSITRVYHDVKRINGPVVVEEKRRREKNIYQRIVEFTLAAGVPSMFGPASITSVVPPEGERIVSDVAQNLIPFPSSELAMPDPILIGVNQSLNPSVETNATGWSAGAVAVSGAGPSTYLTSGRTTETAIVGLASFRARILGNSTTEASGVGDVRIMHTVAGVNVTNPEQLPISLSMWASAGIFAGAAASAIQSIRVDAVWLDAGNATISTLVMGTETSDFTGRTYSVKNVMPPATATSVRFEVHAIVTWASSATAANNSDIRLFADAAAVITPI